MHRADRRRGVVLRAALAVGLTLTLTGLGATSAQALCLPLLMNCGSPTPTPTPSAPGIPGLPLPGIPGVPLPGTIIPGTPEAPLVGVPDPNAPTMTMPAAQLGGSRISIEGLHSIGLVTVPLANGQQSGPVIKISADLVTVDDFLLDVRRSTGPSLVSTADRMQLRGTVQVYIDSLSANLLDGLGITLLANTPTTGYELPPTLLRVTIGLVGVTANSITFTTPHQHLYE